MGIPRLAPKKFALMTGLSELGFGLMLHFQVGGADQVPHPERTVPLLAAAFLLGGTSVLISLRYRLSRLVSAAASLVAAGPLLYLGLYTFGDSVIGGCFLLSLGAGAGSAPWLWLLGQDDQGVGHDPLDLLMGALQTLAGVAWLITGRVSEGRVADAIGTLGRAYSLLLVVAGLALLTLPRWESRGMVSGLLGRLLGALPLLWLSVAMSFVRDWAGAFFTAMVGLVLLLVRKSPVARAPSYVARAADDPAPEVERTIEIWSWAMLPAIIILTVIDDAQGMRHMVQTTAAVLLTAGYNICAYWLMPSRGTPGRRVITHLTVFTLVAGIMLTGRSAIARAYMLVLVVPPMLAARALGIWPARIMQGLGMLAVAVHELSVAFQDGRALTTALPAAAVQMGLLLAAGGMVNRSTADQRRLVQELVETHRGLQDAHAEMAAQSEELAAQQEELHAQNQQLTAQHEHLVVQNLELERTSRALELLAGFDPLTQLMNRRRFHEYLEEQVSIARSGAGYGALLFLDLDRFKYVNDSLGHREGDRVLQRAASQLRTRVNTEGTVARLGGDEFAVLLPSADLEQATAVGENLLEALRDQMVSVNGEALPIRGSVGVALYPEHATDAEELLVCADMAMYAAKAHGRDAVRVFGYGDPFDERPGVLWEREVQAALSEDRFILHFQPIVDLASGETRQHEVLLRMRSRGGELVSPKEFLPPIEHLPLIHAIDRWVIRHSLSVMAARTAAGEPIRLEINLSGRAFEDPELVPTVERCLQETGVCPTDLVFEITETAAIPDLGRARHCVEQIRSLGCGFAIDDFGAGFASFAYLKHLPVSYLKVDGSLIQHLSQHPQDQHLIRAIVAMARGLEVETIAEWVEDETTLRLLQNLGVDMGQGFGIAAPATAPSPARSLPH